MRKKFPDYDIVLEYMNSSTIAQKVVEEGNRCSADIIVSEEGATVIGRALCVITPDMIPSSEEQVLYLEAQEEKLRHPEWFD